MRVLGSLALAAILGGASARQMMKAPKPVVSMEPKGPPQLWKKPEQTAQGEPKAKSEIIEPKGLPMPLKEILEVIWQQQKMDGSDIPLSARGYPYKLDSMENITAVEEGFGKRASGRYQEELTRLRQSAAAKEAAVQAKVRELHSKREEHMEKAELLREEVKDVARRKHLSKVMQVPLDEPLVDVSKEETPEQADAPWPPHEESAAPETPETPATADDARRFPQEELGAPETPETPATADDALSAAESRPAVQGESEEEKPKKPNDWKEEKLNAFYRKKCNLIFSGLDSDDDEIVEEEEIFAYFDAAWHGYDPARLTKKLLDEADEDHDGQVSRTEWHLFAEQASKISKDKESRWNPLVHLKVGVPHLPADFESNIEQLNGYYRRVTTRMFRGMDADKDDSATKAEMVAFLDRKFHEKDPAEFADKIMAEADKDGDGKTTLDEFLNFAAEATKKATNNQEKWNPLLHIADTVLRNKALDTVHIR